MDELHQLHQAQQAPLLQQMEPEEVVHNPIQQEVLQLEQQEEMPHGEVVQEQPLQARAHANKASKSPQPADPQAEALHEQQKARERALRKDAQRVRNDKARHTLYTVIKGFVSVGKTVGRRNKNRNAIQENTEYLQSLDAAYQEMQENRAQAIAEDKLDEFTEQFGAEYTRLSEMVEALNHRVRTEMESELEEGEALVEADYEQRVREAAQDTTITVTFGDQKKVNVVGGTKPNAAQYSSTGSKWLVKEAVSCIGINEPNSAIVTEAGYHIQQLVHPDTAIEAFRGQTVGKGIVSYQRILKGVRGDDVDLFRYSRTPESMSENDLARVQELSPQLLREHTTDWLLCNYDTKGENFLVTRDENDNEKLYGIDKEAAFRRILDKGAQTMSKDYRGFDQETVYNRLFQGFAANKMDLDLHAVLPQIERVEAMDDETYMAQFREYIKQQERDRPEQVDEIRANILKRKQNLRMEYRDFFSKLVEERCANSTPAEAQALRERCCGDRDGGTFLFEGETLQDWQAERERRAQMREANAPQRATQAEIADKKDEKNYKRRHAIYDFSKAFVMGAKRIFKRKKRLKAEEKIAHHISLSEVSTDLERKRFDPDFQERYDTQVAALHGQLRDYNVLNEQEEAELQPLIQEQMNTETISITMSQEHAVQLGGTKPMSEFFASDGTQWLAKQAVNCMGYCKLEGALLTEAGAQLQKVVDPATAVDAFVGRTKHLGDVSFQRRLEHVEDGEDKLDLFKFSKHPEIATDQTIAAVQEMGDQILREHTTDWLLCNFDTKGENFVVTMEEEDGPRVLHGIDKEAAFNKILDPRAQQMSRTYKPHTNNTLYNVVFTMYSNNEMELNLNATLPQIEKIEAMDDDTYMALYTPFLNQKEKSAPDEVERVRESILVRKQCLRDDYCTFFTKLVQDRCKKLHPDEAAALRQRYFDAEGKRFQFPAAENP